MSTEKPTSAFDAWYQHDTVYACHRLEGKLIMPIVKHYKPHSVIQLGNIALDNLPDNTIYAGDALPKNNLAQVSIDYQKLPFRAESFDLIICPHWHEIVASPTCLFAELSRVLVPEGLLVLYSMNPLGVWSIADNMVASDAAAWVNNSYTPEKLSTQTQSWQLEQAYHIYAGSKVAGREHDTQRVQASNVLLGVIHQTVLKKSVLNPALIGAEFEQWAVGSA